ncbi:hypothetical protein KAK07_01480 [Ideonella sp. 4Y16]|uniref:hypothetical protein n=1 Tax=Ideonella alba TaxID=2824118 RepID=UPI001B362016|nr:hypothetical protein [Ideonella alba]MBQ0941997.1 hypothetical protein [Ideonella alba]
MLNSTIRRAIGRSFALLSFSLLAACGGGGGGGGDPSYAVDLSPKPLTARWTDAMVVLEPVSGTAVFDKAPTGTVYPVVVMDAPNFVSETVAVRQISGTTYEVDLTPKSSLSVGVHTGTLTLKLCKDPQCNAVYALTGGSLPYELTVSAAMAVSLTINGVPVPDGRGGQLTAREDDVLTVDISSGDTIELSSHAEVDWVASTNNQVNNSITVLSSTPTSWRAVISGPPNAKDLSVLAIPKDTNQRSAQYSFFIQ